MPPAECVTNAKVTVRQRISMSGMMVLFLGAFGHAAHGVDAVEKRGELDRPTQGAVGALPAVEVGQCGVYLFVR